MKILIAEDEPSVSLILKLALEDRGHQVIATADGEECVNVYRNEVLMHTKQRQPMSDANKKLCQQPFDAVVLDYRMPKKDGMEAAKEILKVNPHQRIIFASAYTLSLLQELSIYLEDNRVEWLQKPFEVEIFADMLEDLPGRLKETPAA